MMVLIPLQLVQGFDGLIHPFAIDFSGGWAKRWEKTLLKMQIKVNAELHTNWRYLNEAEYDMKNSADQGGCYPPRLNAEGQGG